MTAQPDTRPGLNATHLPFLERLLDVADQAGVTVVYCCLNVDWGIMTSPELDDAAGTAFLTALDAGAVGEPEQKSSRTIRAGRQFHGSVCLYVRAVPADDSATEEATYDHTLDLVDERDGIRQYVCRECGAEIVEDTDKGAP